MLSEKSAVWRSFAPLCEQVTKATLEKRFHTDLQEALDLFDLLIRGGVAVTPGGTFRLDLAVHQGKIAGLLKPGMGTAESVIDVSGLHVLPGLVDAHVHLRDPGYPEKESISTGTAAAACGGVTTVLDMPNTIPPVSNGVILKDKAARVAGKAYADVGFYGLLASGKKESLLDLAQAGCVGYKLFLGPTTGDLKAPSSGELLEAFQHLARIGLPTVVHAEDRSIVEYWQERARADGDTYEHFLRSRPEVGEVASTEFIARLAQKTGARVHIAHVALAEAVDVIKRVKAEGWPVTAEACVPHLFLTADDYAAVGGPMKVLPPVRSARDRSALWQGLADGVIDLIATDHAPHVTSEKQQKSVWDTPAGIVGVETMLPLLLDAAASGQCSLNDIARWCASSPANRFGLAGKGRLTVGMDADFAVVDLKSEWRIDPHHLHSCGRATPFSGRAVRGKVVMTLLRGQVVARDGNPCGVPRGRWVKPDRSTERDG